MEAAQALEQIQALLGSFIKGPNRSLEIAREIEGTIASHLPPEHPLQELAEDFAQYCPEGGDGLYAENEMLPKVVAALQWFGKQSSGDIRVRR